MDVLNSIGFVNFWGVTPFINLFETEDELIKKTTINEPVNVLISNSNDLRHFIYTIYKLFVSQKEKGTEYRPINFYIHEDHLEVLCRDLLFLHLITDRNKSIIERCEMLMEIYGNCLLPSRTIDYINITYKLLISFICQDKKSQPVYKNIIDLSCLTHKQIDSMQEIFSSYDSKYPYDIEKYRNDRVRYCLKDRYDYRKNLFDWDYNMNIQNFAPIIRLRYYIFWRENGIAFVMRVNQYKFPNRTLACYIEGKKKQGHDSCMVRGYWGDIVNSPYLSYGLELETREEISYFYANNKIDYLRDSQDVTEYNLVKFLLRMDHDEKYDFMKREKEKERLRQERIKREEEEQKKKEKEEQKKKEKEEKEKKKKLKPIAEQEDEEEEEICTDSQETKERKEKEKKEKEEKEKEEKKKKEEKEKKENEKKDEGIIIGKNDNIKEMTKKLAKVVNESKSSDTTEESLIKAMDNEKTYDTNELIQAFREVKFKIFLVGGEIEKNIYKKKKFKNYFDVILYGFHARSKFNEMQKSILKPTTRLLFELNSYMASFEEKTRKEYRENLVKMCKNNGFVLDDTSLKYLYQFKIKQENQQENQQENEEENEINTTVESNVTESTNA